MNNAYHINVLERSDSFHQVLQPQQRTDAEHFYICIVILFVIMINIRIKLQYFFQFISYLLNNMFWLP